MKGARAISENQIREVMEGFSGQSRLRDRALVILGCRAGFRISELLSLRLRDILQDGKVADRVGVARENMKQKMEGRCTVLHLQARVAITELLTELTSQGMASPETFLFQSQRGTNQPLTRTGAWTLLKKAFTRAGLVGKGYSCHTLRKVFADRVYKSLAFDLVKTQRAMGHRNIQSTISYLSFQESEIESAILSA